MAYQEKPLAGRSAAYSPAVDQGLRSFMLRVYNYMAVALFLTGVVAFGVSTNESLMATLYGSSLKWVVMFAPLGLVLFFSARIHRMSFASAQMLFWVYAATVGLSIGWIFVMYTGQSVARVFFISAGTFGLMSLYGYTTQRDLSGMGSFLMMGLLGIFLASIVNLFMKSSALSFAVSVIGVLVFVGLTAYDTQMIRQGYLEADDADTVGKKALMGALHLYLDFINLFMMMLRLFGDRR